MGNLKLDESWSSNPKSQIGLSNLKFSDFGFEIQDSSNFKFPEAAQD